MINSLYDNFKHWSKTGSVYIISDPHFDDADSKLMNPRWPSSQEQVDILNKYVHRTDTIVILGDIGNTEWVSKIKAGYKVLIMGNHDSGISNYQKRNMFVKEFDTIAEAELSQDNNEIDWYECDFHKPFIAGYKCNHLFDEVYEGPLIISEKLILCHYPIILPYMSCIHGHTHNAQMRYDNEYGCHCICVASDVCEWKPVNLGKEIKNGLLSNTPSIHRNYIDNHVPINKFNEDEKYLIDYVREEYETTLSDKELVELYEQYSEEEWSAQWEDNVEGLFIEWLKKYEQKEH